MPLRLITIPISHYCDKARWGLERAGLTYVEEAHLQGIHYLAVLREGRSITVPVLVTPGGSLTESSDILHYADERMAPDSRLYPDEHRDEIEGLERRFDEELGPATRLWIYHQLFDAIEILLKYGSSGVPEWQRRAARLTLRVVPAFIRRRYSIDTESAMAAREDFLRTLEQMGRRLSDGRPYLVGDGFTAADLTFAALTAPVVLPDQYGVKLPRLDELPPAAAMQVRACREHPAGEFALRMYAQERLPST